MPTGGSKNNKIVVVAAVTTTTAAAVATYLLWRKSSSDGYSRNRNTFPVKYDAPPSSLVMSILCSLPSPVRRYLALKTANPKHPADGCDVLLAAAAAAAAAATAADEEESKGKTNAVVPPPQKEEEQHDPYQMTELIPGKLYRVRYYHLAPNNTVQGIKNFCGVDMLDPTFLDSVPSEKRTLLEEDTRHFAQIEDMSNKDLFEGGYFSHTNMFIVVLPAPIDGDGGGKNKKKALLLYNPVRMHPRLLDWMSTTLLDGDADGGMGVEYVVSGSTAHTNFIPHVFNDELFPNATLISSKAAYDKCIAGGMKRPAKYYHYDHPDDFRRVQEELKCRGGGTSLEVFHVRGDCVTQAFSILIGRHLLTVDLLYGHYDGDRLITTEPRNWDRGCCGAAREGEFSFISRTQGGRRDIHRCIGGRMFYYALMYGTNSPNGMLPVYRFMGMDPTSSMAKLLLDPPQQDGSSCVEMARSLRGLLALDFDVVDDVHAMLDGSIDGDEFRKCIDGSWMWLDGKSLLPSK